ncbi:MAG: IS110 family transposase [Prevotellaceae bacterium]|jgi:transposase|nr:IS110 family transposase [Prevotellaceae bacterium]
MQKFVVGIDVSKKKLDLCLTIDGVIAKEWVVDNRQDALSASLSSVIKRFKQPEEAALICAEYTGQYVYPLCCACEALRLPLWLENPYQIKHSLGLHRGKNDRVDARRISEYAGRFSDRARLFSMPEKVLSSLRQLLSERELYVTDKGKYQALLTDQVQFIPKGDYQAKSKRLKRVIEELRASIAEVEEKMQALVKGDEELSSMFKQLCSVEGVGEHTAMKMIVATDGFRSFDDPRKFCCHAGIAPFEYTSGSSVRSRRRVSQRADKSIKALLHMAALVAATRMTGELHEYYLKKVAEGKNKMSVLNAVRSKLVYRMFSVVKRDTVYDKNYANKLA